MLEHLNVAIIRLCMGISNEIKVPMIAIIKWNNDLWQHSCVMTAKKSAKKGAADSEFWVFFFIGRGYQGYMYLVFWKQFPATGYLNRAKKHW